MNFLDIPTIFYSNTPIIPMPNSLIIWRALLNTHQLIARCSCAAFTPYMKC